MDGLEARMKAVEHVLFGNGQPGIQRQFTEFTAEWRGREIERERQAKRSDRKWNLRMVALGVICAGAELAMHGCSHSHIALLTDHAQAITPPQDAVAGQTHF